MSRQKNEDEAKQEVDVPEGEVSPDAAATAATVAPVAVPEHTKPGPTSKLEQVAREALAGKYGYGVARRLKLVELGFDPNEVQRETVRLVNS